MRNFAGCHFGRPLTFLLSVFLLSTVVLTSLSAAPTPSPRQPLDNPLEPLAPTTTRTEEGEDRLTALALFSAGRMLEQRQQPAAALRRYQRALRYDPEALPVLREMVPLAFSLDRPDEALRYAVKFVEKNPIDLVLLRRSAEYLAETNDWTGALKLYEQVERLLSKEKVSSQQTLLQMELGRLRFLTEDYAGAAAAFRRVIDALDKPEEFALDAPTRKALQGENGNTYELMGSVFLEADRPDDAADAFARFEKLKPNPAVAAFNNARVALARKKPSVALEELDNYFASGDDKKGIAPYELLAKALRETESDEQKADAKLLERLSQLRQQQPDNAALAFYLGDRYREAGDLAKARPLLETALAKQPTAQGYRALAEVYRRTSEPAALLKLLTTMYQKSGSLAPLDKEAEAIAADQKFVAAIADHAGAKPSGAAALTVAGLLAADAKQWPVAKELFELAIKAEPKKAAEVLTGLGLALFLDEKYDDAVAVFQRGIAEKALPDDNPVFHFYLAGALEMQGKTDEALAAARTAAEKAPKNPRFASRPAWILYHAKRNAEATAAYEAFVKKFDDDFTTPGVRDVLREARLVLSNLCVLQNDIPGSIEWLEQLLDEFPDDIGASNDLGYVWADNNQHLNRAHKMIELAVAAEPDNAAYRDSLGWVLFRKGRYGEAVIELQKAAAEDEPDGTVLEHLGDVYQKLRQRGEARAAWERARQAYLRDGDEDRAESMKIKLDTSEFQEAGYLPEEQ